MECLANFCLVFSLQAFGNEQYRNDALVSMNRLLQNASSDEGNLLHVAYQKGKNETGFLEDYAFTISALINVYQITFDERWLSEAKKLADYTISQYYDEEHGFFWFTSNLETALIARKKEITDNVISSSNSEMANALFKLDHILEEKKYNEIAARMMKAVEGNISHYPSSYSNWLNLLMNFTSHVDEIVICGENADVERKIMAAHYLPNAVFCGTKVSTSTLPLLQNRFRPGKTLIYICRDKTCKLPVENSLTGLASIGVKQY